MATDAWLRTWASLANYDRTPKPDLCERDGVGLPDLFRGEFVAFDWLPTQTVMAGATVDVPLVLSQWSSSKSEPRAVRLRWVEGDSAEASVGLPAHAPLPKTLQLTAPNAAGSATLVAELLDGDGKRTAANRITVSVE